VCDSVLNPSPNERINTHLAPPPSFSTTITAYDDKLFNHQRNNVRNTQTLRWQSEKAGNVGDLNSYVHEDSSKKQEQTSTNTSLYGEEKLWKVTQPPNVIRSYSTLSRCNERRGNKHNEHERNIVRTPTQQDLKTSLRTASGGMVAAKQISHNRNSREDAAESNSCRQNRHDVGENNRLLQNHSNNRMEHINERRVIHGDERYVANINCATPSTSITIETTSPSMSRKSSQIVLNPLSISSQDYFKAANSSRSVQSASNYKSELDRKSSENVIASINVECLDNCAGNGGKCGEVIREDIEGNRADAVLAFDSELKASSEKSDVKSSQSTDKSSSKASSEPILNADNLIITSAIENLSVVFAPTGTSCKVKYSNDIMTMRAKRRRDRRDRRLGRTRPTVGASLSSSSTNEILPDIINNHLPPPYADIPPQQIVPSIISTVPVEDNRYSFSLPLVRR
jgi:hypothetical protein